ncbi:Abi family protein [Georgenia sp. TF02-10]|uniref:Abi family protein n=1 Tax=Georgenia sp. TF02-10 TaxID=2917725 RepID=UPI001FA6FD9C|nr:Abi family protein [Georgenia sp. TF02-10]UNX53374.1 Abi family protein [Georgenia sp. TF02-10]
MALDALVDRLSARGLAIPDRDRALRYLRHIGYYRLSPYTIPFQQGRPDHLMREGTSFDDVLDLYVFDRALRLLVIDALERVEVAVRAALTDHMSTAYDDPHWYMDASHFRDRGRHAGLLKIVRDTCDERLRGTPDAGEDSLVHRSALEHYLTTYGSPELPPSWLMVETLTIGQVTSAYRNLKRRADRTMVARSIGLTAPVLESWMQTCVRVRNICAHHGRLWNVGLGVYPAIPTSPTVSWLEDVDVMPDRSTKRLYPVLVSLQTVLETVSPGSGWANRLYRLIDSRPAMNLRGMGIPENWAGDPFWRRHLD